MNLNTQKQLPPVGDVGKVLVHSIWPTIQGEGPFAGERAIFVRLFGCNIQCPFCDTDYTSTCEEYLTNAELVAGAKTLYDLEMTVASFTNIGNSLTVHRRPLLVITGGEPFRQPIGPLVEHFILAGYRVQIETNGTIFREVHSRATIVCSPKTPRIDAEMAKRANAFKYVLDASHVDPVDGLPAGTLGKYGGTARPPETFFGDIFVQPLDEDNADCNSANLAACVHSVMRHGYRLCIQTHKLANVP